MVALWALAAALTLQLVAVVIARWRWRARWTWRAMTPRTEEVAPIQRRSIELVHPYLGYVLHPLATRADWDRTGWPMPEVNAMGFEGPMPCRPALPHGIRVLVVGGSVAKAFAADAEDYLAGALRSYLYELGAPDGEVEIVSAALGGYKQPQQLMTVAYLLSLGAHLDLVVNLDGFNEVALYLAENCHQGQCPSFPRMWYGRSLVEPDHARNRLQGEVAYLRARAAEVEGGWWARASPLGLVTACLHGERLRAQAWQRERMLREWRPVERAPLNGALETLGDEASVAIWERSSLQLSRLCRASSIGYVHALQPNQYVEGSKRMTDEERAIAYDPEHPYRPGVVALYPSLQRRGRSLAAQGVCFRDLSNVFADVEEPTYIDTMCHVSRAGNLTMARALVPAMTEALTAARTARSDRRRRPG